DSRSFGFGATVGVLSELAGWVVVGDCPLAEVESVNANATVIIQIRIEAPLTKRIFLTQKAQRRKVLPHVKGLLCVFAPSRESSPIDQQRTTDRANPAS